MGGGYGQSYGGYGQSYGGYGQPHGGYDKPTGYGSPNYDSQPKYDEGKNDEKTYTDAPYQPKNYGKPYSSGHYDQPKGPYSQGPYNSYPDRYGRPYDSGRRHFYGGSPPQKPYSRPQEPYHSPQGTDSGSDPGSYS